MNPEFIYVASLAVLLYSAEKPFSETLSTVIAYIAIPLGKLAKK